MTGDGSAIPAGVRRDRSGAVWRGLSDSLGFLGTAVRLLGRHGPALFALAFGGVAVQWCVMALAKQAAKLHPLAGLLTLMIVPLVVLAVYVLMMRVVRGSLRFARAAQASTGGHRNALDHLGSVLLPFLAVWAAQGFLDDLVEQYRFAVWHDVVGENLSHLGDAVMPKPITAGERLDVNLSVAVVVVVVVAFAARWGIGRLRNTDDPLRPPRGPRWLGVLGAYFESVWLMLLFVPLAAIPATVLGWAGERRIIAWFTSAKNDAVAHLGSFSNPADGALSWIGDLFGNAQTVILAPVAWLTVGAIIYGYRLPDLSGESNDHEDRHSTGGGFGKWVAAKARGQFHGRFGPLVGGLRLLARGSTRPLLLFCLLFVVISPLLLGDRRLLGLEGWLWDLERLIAGPQDRNTWFFLSYTLGPVNQAIQDVVLICLLTAAIDRLVLAQRVDRDLRAAPPAEPSTTDTATTAEQPAPQPAHPVPVLVGASAAAPYAVALQPPPGPPMPVSAQPMWQYPAPPQPVTGYLQHPTAPPQPAGPYAPPPGYGVQPPAQPPHYSAAPYSVQQPPRGPMPPYQAGYPAPPYPAPPYPVPPQVPGPYAPHPQAPTYQARPPYPVPPQVPAPPQPTGSFAAPPAAVVAQETTAQIPVQRGAEDDEPTRETPQQALVWPEKS